MLPGRGLGGSRHRRRQLVLRRALLARQDIVTLLSPHARRLPPLAAPIPPCSGLFTWDELDEAGGPLGRPLAV